MSSPESPNDQPTQPNQEPPNWTQYSQPTYQPQPPQVQPRAQASRRPGRNYRGCLLALGGIALTIAVCVGGVLALDAFGGNNSAGNQQQGSVPTNTPAPPATATPATTQQAIADIANALLGGGASVKFSQGTATVTETLTSPTLDPATTAEAIKNGTFQLLQQLYTSDLPIKEVDYNVNGPLVDQHGNTSIGPYAEVTLTAATAKHFNWSNLTPDQAWGEYDSAFVRTH